MAYGKEIRIAIMGATGSGKTTFINCASGSDFAIGKGLESCTSEIQTSKPFRLNGRIISLIDTPGFDDTSRKDTDILKLIAAYLQNTYEQGAKLAGVIYMHRISDFRMGGTSKRNFAMFRELCGESNLKSVLLVSNMWSEVKRELGEAREAELAGKDKFFKPVLEKGARMLRHDGTQASAHTILRHLINQQPATLRIQDELVNQHKDIAHTAAGVELTRALQYQADLHSEELSNLKAEMEKALTAKDEETREELREEVEKKHQEIMMIQRDAQQLAAEYAAEKAKLDAKIFEMEDIHRKQVEALEALHDEVSAVQQQMEEKQEGYARKERELLAAKQIEDEERARVLEEGKRAKEREEEDNRRRLQLLQEEVIRARNEMRQAEEARAEDARRDRERAEQGAAEQERQMQLAEEQRAAKAKEEEEHRQRLRDEIARMQREVEQAKLEQGRKDQEMAALKRAAEEARARLLEKQKEAKDREDEEFRKRLQEEVSRHKQTEDARRARFVKEEEARRARLAKEGEARRARLVKEEKARKEAKNQKQRESQEELAKARREVEQAKAAQARTEVEQERASDDVLRSQSLPGPFGLISSIVGWFRGS
ncbi:hypothetical protein BV22DRAFT_520655 [Leucogyrophana mollusca]|uniref:Uncharacterized protein n=1 Tax=Leucogyrophana mollusca TaxID=85980 RepID=A0ACB8BI83_9AGAM|nr:hypothetical protein BV22DRAFT_520655 [Leucogyrophana mollusca]